MNYVKKKEGSGENEKYSADGRSSVILHVFYNFELRIGGAPNNLDRVFREALPPLPGRLIGMCFRRKVVLKNYRLDVLPDVNSPFGYEIKGCEFQFVFP